VRDESGEAGVGNEDVAAAAQDVERQRSAARELHGVADVLRRGAVAEKAGGPAEADRGERREGNGFSNQRVESRDRGTIS
jgi:hypothetical protein